MKLVHPVRLGDVLQKSMDLVSYVNSVCDRVEEIEPEIHALLPESGRRNRLISEAEELQKKFPNSDKRPPLYGLLLGVKDIFHVQGMLTKAGSKLPPEDLAGEEAMCVSRLRKAGALILGKTVTTEFALYAPGPTGNPHDIERTPGGSSSGSAAAVAAGYCPLAFGSQTIGSILRPAAYCGVVGFKPTWNRISPEGVIPVSPQLDHVGLLSSDIEGLEHVLPHLFSEWRSAEDKGTTRLAVPEGPYLQLVEEGARQIFEAWVSRLEGEGMQVQRVSYMDDFDDVVNWTRRLLCGELALCHRVWFEAYHSLYHPVTVQFIEKGQNVSDGELETLRDKRAAFISRMLDMMNLHNIDAWISPSATGPAPMGLDHTGDFRMNLPWTSAGFPSISLPVGCDASGLPLGLQVVSRPMTDERLLRWSKGLLTTLHS